MVASIASGALFEREISMRYWRKHTETAPLCAERRRKIAHRETVSAAYRSDRHQHRAHDRGWHALYAQRGVYQRALRRWGCA